jgi:hypothetical protein
VTCDLKNVTVDQFRAGLVFNVGRNFVPISLRQKISEKVKTDDFFIWKPQMNFSIDFTLSTYPHKLQNLSFNMAVTKIRCSLKHRIYRQNKCVQDFTVTLYVTM